MLLPSRLGLPLPLASAPSSSPSAPPSTMAASSTGAPVVGAPSKDALPAPEPFATSAPASPASSASPGLWAKPLPNGRADWPSPVTTTKVEGKASGGYNAVALSMYVCREPVKCLRVVESVLLQ